MQSVPANAEIDLQNCTGEWCFASWRNRAGYIPAFAVGEAGAPQGFAMEPAPPPVAMGPPPVVVDTPVYVAPAYGWGGPYVGFGWGYGWRRW